VLVALAIALLLGLRHATDPDHLTAVSTLVMSQDLRGARRAAKLGASPRGTAAAALAGGYFHVHEHTHGEVRHAHPHVHETEPAEPHPHVHEHSHAPQLGRSPLAAFGIGLIHGAGGSAGVAVLVVAAVPGTGAATAALAVLALGTALSMTAVTALFGGALARGPLPRKFELAAPVLGAFSLAFGVWCGLAALSAVPYVF
jgi:VIT1/CCC1 family predicted Fe2+/Mn2+ transporter